MWLPLVHVHVLHLAARGLVVSVATAWYCVHWLVGGCCVGSDMVGGSIASAGWWLCMASDGYAGLLSGLSGLAM